MTRKDLDAIIKEYADMDNGGNIAAHAAVCVLRMVDPSKVTVDWLRSQYAYESSRTSSFSSPDSVAFHKERIRCKHEALTKVAKLLEKDEI